MKPIERRIKKLEQKHGSSVGPKIVYYCYEEDEEKVKSAARIKAISEWEADNRPLDECAEPEFFKITFVSPKPRTGPLERPYTNMP